MKYYMMNTWIIMMYRIDSASAINIGYIIYIYESSWIIYFVPSHALCSYRTWLRWSFHHLSCAFFGAGEFGPTAWPYGPRRLPVERPHSAQCAKDFHPKSPYNHARPTRPASAKAALVTPRPSARLGPIKPTRPSTRPASAPSARPPSRPSSARPASARPSSARPASARPVSARPQSARPTSATSSGPSARLESELEQGWVHPSAMSEKPHASLMDIGQKRSRPQSAPVFKNSNDASHFEADAMLGGQSILFQQQDFLEKQAGGDDGKLQQCFTTLMHNWVTSYQKSRLRARMACRPLFGEGMQKDEMKDVCSREIE